MAVFRKKLLSEEKEQIAQALMNIGIVYEKQNKFEDAVSYFESYLKISLKLYEKATDNFNEGNKETQTSSKILLFNKKNLSEQQRSILKTYQIIGSCLYRHRKYEAAIFNYEKSLAISEKAPESEHNSDIYWNIDLNYFQLEKYDKALINYEKSLEISKKIFKTEEHFQIADTLTYIRLMHTYLEQYEKALFNYEKSLDIFSKLFPTKEHAVIASNLASIGLVYFQLKKYQNAFETYQKALEIKAKLKESDEILICKFQQSFHMLFHSSGHEHCFGPKSDPNSFQLC